MTEFIVVDKLRMLDVLMMKRRWATVDSGAFCLVVILAAHKYRNGGHGRSRQHIGDGIHLTNEMYIFSNFLLGRARK